MRRNPRRTQKFWDTQLDAFPQRVQVSFGASIGTQTVLIEIRCVSPQFLPINAGIVTAFGHDHFLTSIFVIHPLSHHVPLCVLDTDRLTGGSPSEITRQNGASYEILSPNCL
jgi:hypothetical protein